MKTSYDPYATSGAAASASAGMLILGIVFYAAMIAFAVYCYWRVAKKAGYPGAYALLCFIPLVNLVVLCMFVFKDWPIEAELRALRHGSGGGYPAAGGYATAAPQTYQAHAPGQVPSYGAPSPYPQQPSTNSYSAQQPTSAPAQQAFDPGAGAPSWFRGSPQS